MNNSILSNSTKLILGISGIVAFFIAVIGLIITLVYRKKIINKYVNHDEAIELEKLKIKNPNYGIVLTGLKKHYKNVDIADFFVAFLVNSIYLNDYHSIYIESNSDYLALSLANLSMQLVDYKKNLNFESNINILKDAINTSLINEVSQIDKAYDMMIFLNDFTNLENKITNSLPYLNNKGMIIIEFDTIKTIKNLKSFFSTNKLKYETIKFDHKNVILLAKDIKEELAIENKE
ncbi:BC85_0335 family putative methyltransferase [Metamycoplasma buccale]|uniref:BC85_0335 family putative methyltransferase n=1 Tax=Metamycoplasma buccale TaxID=55602 RepID=UPI00398F5C57